MTPPTPAAELQAVSDEPSAHCPVCDCELAPIVSNIWRRYECGKILWWIDGAWDMNHDVACGNAEAAAVAQRQRADAAEEQVKRLAIAVNSAAETAATYLAERDAALVRADTEYAARIRLVQEYDKLDAEREEQRERGDKYASGWINETKRADAYSREIDRLRDGFCELHQPDPNDPAPCPECNAIYQRERAASAAAQGAALRVALDSIVEYAGPADDTGNSFWQCRACGWPVGPIRLKRDAVKHAPDCAYIAAKTALAAAPEGEQT